MQNYKSINWRAGASQLMCIDFVAIYCIVGLICIGTERVN